MSSHVSTTIRYDGPALADHQMDVQDLAPALLALADIVQIANRRFNGDAANMRILVKADVEQRCFQVDIHLVQSLVEQAKTFFGRDDVATAKEIAEWVGIVGGSGFGLFQLLGFVHRRGAQSGTTFTNAAGGTVIVVNGEGNSVTVPAPVAELAMDPVVVSKAKGVVRPLERPGYETLGFYSGDQEVFQADKEVAAGILEAVVASPDEHRTESVIEMRARVRIKAAQYEGLAKWSVLLNGRAVETTMGDAEWLHAFQHNQLAAPPNSILEVEMRQVDALDENGVAVGKPTYEITRVHKVELPPRVAEQIDWVDETETAEAPQQEQVRVTRD